MKDASLLRIKNALGWSNKSKKSFILRLTVVGFAEVGLVEPGLEHERHGLAVDLVDAAFELLPIANVGPRDKNFQMGSSALYLSKL